LFTRWPGQKLFLSCYCYIMVSETECKISLECPEFDLVVIEFWVKEFMLSHHHSMKKCFNKFFIFMDKDIIMLLILTRYQFLNKHSHLHFLWFSMPTMFLIESSLRDWPEILNVFDCSKQ
jgi:hypothetical protein